MRILGHINYGKARKPKPEKVRLHDGRSDISILRAERDRMLTHLRALEGRLAGIDLAIEIWSRGDG